MAAVDSLLKLAESQGADELTIVADDVPYLLKAGIQKKLTMPAISGDLVTLFATEVVGPEQTEELMSGQSLRGIYKTGDGLMFKYEVERQGETCLLRLRPSNRFAVGDDGNPSKLNSAATPMPLEDSPVATRLVSQSKKVLHPGATAHVPSQFLSSIEHALDGGASDIFFTAGDSPRIRVNGEIDILHGLTVDEDNILKMLGDGLSKEQSSALEEVGSVDLAVSLNIRGNTRRFRISLFSHHHGLAAALRPIRNQIPSLKELNLPGRLREICSYPNGLVLVTGASGAGKSTTLAALLEHINQNRACHIITLEDPIEFEYTNGRALIHQRELGRHMNSFSSGLTAALRESPDVILLGEMRDAATVAAALTAAETGHLVLSTLHTGDAASAIDRIIDVFPGHQQAQVRHQLASVLRVVLTQILVPAAVSFGRVPAIEKLKVTGGAACHIREGRSHQIAGVIQAGGGDGMITLERSLAGLVNNKMITLKTALTYARDEEGLRKLISGGL